MKIDRLLYKAKELASRNSKNVTSAFAIFEDDNTLTLQINYAYKKQIYNKLKTIEECYGILNNLPEECIEKTLPMFINDLPDDAECSGVRIDHMGGVIPYG